MTSCASRPAQSVYSISWPQSVSRAPEWCGAAAAGRRIAFGMPQIVWSQGLVRSCSGRGQRLGLRPRRLRQQLSASEGSDHEQHNDDTTKAPIGLVQARVLARAHASVAVARCPVTSRWSQVATLLATSKPRGRRAAHLSGRQPLEMPVRHQLVKAT